uniref:Cell adhesion molecule 2-like n=1 Tax=Petromyzon marinus TaxID=7757 RepID=A0AAJ7SIM9_PETMA
PPSPPIITGDTGPIREGDSASLLCSTNHSKPAAQVAWFRDGQSLNGSQLVTPDPDDTVATFAVSSAVTFHPRRQDEAAILECRVTQLGSEVATATQLLTVHFPPRVSLQRRETITTVGQTTSLSCETEGNPRPRITWSRLHGNLSADVVAVGDGRLVFPRVRLHDDGEYACLATSVAGSDTAIMKLHVTEPTTTKGTSPSPSSSSSFNNTGEAWDPASPRDSGGSRDTPLIAGVTAVVVFVLLCLLVLLGRHLAAGRKGTYVTHEGLRGGDDFPESENLTGERDTDGDAREYMM